MNPRTLDLTAAERDFAITAAAALNTPRAIKKFTNLYRLMRARLDEHSGELDEFLDEAGTDIPDYQAVLILLAVLIAFPDESPDLLNHLGDLSPRSDPDPRSGTDYVEGREWRCGPRAPELASYLAAATRTPTNGAQSTREPFRRGRSKCRATRSARVKRFTHAISRPPPETEQPPPGAEAATDDSPAAGAQRTGASGPDGAINTTPRG